MKWIDVPLALGAKLCSLALAFFAIAVPLVVLPYQVFWFFKLGRWTSVSVLDTLKFFFSPGVDSWLLFPTDWLGLHKALEWLPSAFALPVILFPLAVMLQAIAEDLEK